MLHPVGELPPVVYWRRRALVVALAVALVVGGGSVAVSALTGDAGPAPVAAATTSAAASLGAPSLEQVVPSLAAVQTPSAPTETTGAEPALTPEPAAPAAPAYTEGQACSDAMLSIGVLPDPAQAAVGSKPTFTLTVTNTSPVSCTRALDAGLREVVLVDGTGNRVWGSNDCYPEASSDTRTLAAGEAVSFPVLWSGLTSNPGCTAARVAPPAGQYQLQGRIDTAVGVLVPFALQ